MPPKERFHLYLLMGQSNMSGCGTVEGEDKVSPPRILRLDHDGRWVPAVEPLHFEVEGRGVGPGLSFAKTMVKENEAVTIGLIPCAVGGTALEQWKKGQELYNNAVARAREAMKSGTMKGVLWHQGESDSGSEEAAATYGSRFKQMIADLREELTVPDLPVVVGTLGDFVQSAQNCSFAERVNQEIEHIPELVPFTGCAYSKGLKNQDEVHFTSEAQRELGRRYAVEMARILQ